MKRSEMVEKLLRFVDGDKDKADLLLMDLELFGMLPPAAKMTYEEFQVLQRYGTTKDFHRWENE